jgi:hypothetical protein
MKKLHLLASLVFSAVFTTSSFAQDADDSLRPLVSFMANAVMKIGMTRAQLVAELGAPSAKLGDNVWAYWDFRAMGRLVGERHDALVVIFVDEKISLLRLTERTQVETAIARLRAAQAAKSPIVARK